MRMKELLAAAALALVLTTGAHAQTSADPSRSAGITRPADTEAAGRGPKMAASEGYEPRAKVAASEGYEPRPKMAASEGYEPRPKVA